MDTQRAFEVCSRKMGFRSVEERATTQETLDAVKTGARTTGDLAQRLGLSRTAAAMRLGRLWEIGLLDREDQPGRKPMLYSIPSAS